MKHIIRTVAVALLASFLPAAFAREQTDTTSIPSPSGSMIGYATVDEALQSLKTKSGVSITTTQPGGWTIATDRATFTQWSFTPAGHYAHPSVVRREIKQSEKSIYVEMSALCQSTKSQCDKLMGEFNQLNERMRQSIQGRVGASSPQ